MSSNIPLARHCIREAIMLLRDPLAPRTSVTRKLNLALKHMVRKERVTTREPRARKAYMTASMRAHVLNFVREHPGMSAALIAKALGTDPKRTKELVNAAK